MTAPFLDGKVEGQRLTVEAKEGEPQRASASRPACDLAVDALRLRVRADRGPIPPFPGGRLDSETLVEQLVQSRRAVLDGHLEPPAAFQLPPTAAELAQHLSVEAASIPLPVSVGLDVRGQLERPLENAVAGLLPNCAQVRGRQGLGGDKCEVEATRLTRYELQRDGAGSDVVLGEDSKGRSVVIGRRGEDCAPALERDERAETALSADADDLERSATKCPPPGEDPTWPKPRRRGLGTIGELIPLIDGFRDRKSVV